jgi:hypothetical protein
LAADCHLSPIANTLQVGTSPELIGKSRDGFGKSQFLNDAIVIKIMSGALAQEVNNPLRRIQLPAPFFKLRYYRSTSSR